MRRNRERLITAFNQNERSCKADKNNYMFATNTKQCAYIDDYKFYYFNTVICHVNMHDKTCIINDGGWKTSSTTQAINEYINYFVYGLGYTLIDEREGK